jgi:hypothetical protein
MRDTERMNRGGIFFAGKSAGPQRRACSKTKCEKPDYLITLLIETHATLTLSVHAI